MDILIYLIVTVIFYIILLFLMKRLGFWKKQEQGEFPNCCPDCNNPLERIRKRKKDYIVIFFTFQIFNFMRFKCYNCMWEGRRWERPFYKKF